MRSFFPLLALAGSLLAQPPDPRNIKSGLIIPDEGYSDQPSCDAASVVSLRSGLHNSSTL